MSNNHRLSNPATEQSTYPISITLRDSDGVAITPNGDIRWSLSDEEDNVINGRLNVEYSGSYSPIAITLSGDDLVMQRRVDRELRYLTITCTYDSDLGADQPFVDWVEFWVYSVHADLDGVGVDIPAPYRSIYNVRAYGAVGDGVTDDSAAFAAVAAAVEESEYPVTVYFPPNNRYVYSSGLTFTKPVRLLGAYGAVLDYQGTGYAIQFGPDGLDDTTYVNYRQPYIVEGLGFTGGASMTHGIYFNDHIVYTSVRFCWFENFGNSTAYAIWYQSDNWDAEVTHNNCLVTSGTKNFLRVRGYSTGSVADNGNSRLRLTHNNLTNIGTGGGIGIWLNGANNEVSNNKVEGFSANIRVGGWANSSRITNNYFESLGTARCAIEFGDPSDGDIPNSFIRELSITNNFANLHNTDLGSTAYFLAPTAATSGLQSAKIRDNTIAGSDASREYVHLNNLANQSGNESYNNRNSDGTQNPNHTVGGNRTDWNLRFNNHADTPYYIEVQSGDTTDTYAGFRMYNRSALIGQIASAPNGTMQITAIGSNPISLESPVAVKQGTLTYSTTVSVNAGAAADFLLTATNGTGFTIANPTNPFTGMHMTIRIKNTSGGALGTVTWDTAYKLATWASPATGYSKAIVFHYDGTNWIELYRSGDVPN